VSNPNIATQTMFEIFPWTPHHETGIALIDEQHRRLVSMLNRLAQQHAQGASPDDIQTILGGLADYADYHFKYEESVWQRALAGDDWLNQHVRTHQGFFEHITQLNSGARPFNDVLGDLFPFLVRWLAQHILEDDKRMALATLAVRKGAHIESAKAQATAEMATAGPVLTQALLNMNQALAEQAMALEQEKQARMAALASLQDNENRWKALLNDPNASAAHASESEKRLRSIIDNLPAGVAVANIQTRRFVFANPWFCQMLGYSEDELCQMDPADIHPAEALPEVVHDFQLMSDGNSIRSLAIPVRRKNGSCFIAQIERVKLDFGGMPCAAAVFTDVSKRENAQKALEAERLRSQNAIEAAQAGTWEWDLVHRTVRCNDRIAAMLGRQPFPGHLAPFEAFMELMHPDDIQRGKYLLKQHLSGESASFEIELRLRHTQGHWVWWRNLGRVMQRNPDGAPALLAGISIDITDQRNQREQIDHFRHNDALTGQPNRRTFVARLAEAMASCDASTKLGVAYLDLDGLGAINTAFGRDIGNEVVLEVSRRLYNGLSEGQLLGHIGGDEFAIVLNDPGQTPSYATPLQQLLDVVAEPVRLKHITVNLTASIGLAIYTKADAVDAEQLLRQADQAMYLAKLAGKNRFHLFDPVNDESTREKLARIEDIRRGLEHNEFVLYYQPKVNLLSGEVIGFEALIRWQHPTQGLLAPASFIPLLNQHPVAITLGDWVIEHALAQMATWLLQGLSTTVSVNIDAMQLHDPDFISRLLCQLHSQPTVRPDQLELEILETGALENMTHVSALISELQDLGISCALDDFGTGYSSLTFLKQLTAHTVKIDQSFVQGMLDDAEDATIVNSVLTLANNFDRRALAEGIETEAHGKALIDFNCEFGQGYAIARPMPAADVLPWLAQWHLPVSWTQTHTKATQDIAALLAETEHRAWLKHLHAFVAQQVPLPPTHQAHVCRFGQWLNKPSTRKRFGQQADSSLLTLMHNQLHQQAEQVLTRVQSDRLADLSSELAVIDRLSADMLSVLHRMRQAEPDSQWSDTFHTQF
jgi:diguanylate cyclase (GGDEF)-like protein/hemerythrin-like metal-binding protein/PAS domain S-box-containing protein